MTDETTTIIMLDLGQQVARLSQLTDQIQDELRRSPQPLSPRITQCMTQLSGSLTRFGRQVARNDDDLKNMRALADIGQVVNSTLELSDVLRVVMDTIIRLTRAERGFLMLRDNGHDLTTRIARNWEQESLDPS